MEMLMSQLTFAVLAINFALVLYTIGVFSERFSRRLKPWHLGFFWGGLVFDTLGTETMSRIAGGFHLNLHGATGALALVLMAVHAIWATLTLLRGDASGVRNFHKFSLMVWGFWLIPFAVGAVLNSGLV
jgi:uncharacterized repeat protein (TIGR03987 family)